MVSFQGYHYTITYCFYSKHNAGAPYKLAGSSPVRPAINALLLFLFSNHIQITSAVTKQIVMISLPLASVSK